jgi:hypothetical protein
LCSVKNAAARLVTGLLKFDHITRALRELHWLPVRKRIDYKVALLVFKCLHGLAASYLADDCRFVSSIVGCRQLRSASTCCLCLFVGCFTAHQHLGHIGPTLGGDKEYIRRGMAISRLLRQAGLGRGSILPTRCHTGMCRGLVLQLDHAFSPSTDLQSGSSLLRPPSIHSLPDSRLF